MTLVTGINASLARWHWQADEGLTCRLRQGRGGIRPPKHPRFQNLTSLGMLKACGKWLSICGCGCDPVGHQCTWESLEDSPDTPTFLHRTSVTELANKMKHQYMDKTLDFIFFTYVSQFFLACSL